MRLPTLQWERIVFRGHAVRRKFEWRIAKEEVVAVLRTGEVIMEYHEDKPFPSCLMLGFSGVRPLHALAAFDPAIWQPDFRTRRLS